MGVSTRSAQLLTRSAASVWHPCTQMKDHEAAADDPDCAAARGLARGLRGRRYLDAISSWWVNLFGHANPRINAAVREQLDSLEHVILAGFTHEPVIELAEALTASHPPGLTRCFYADNGSSAVEVAMKMSFHYWRNMGRRDKRGSSRSPTAITAKHSAPWRSATSSCTRRSTSRC